MKILKFFADWCGPCKQLSKNIDKFKELHPEIEFVSINVDMDENEDIVSKYNIRNIPVLIKTIDDSEVARHAGFLTLSDLENFIFTDQSEC